MGWFKDYKGPNDKTRLSKTQAEYFISFCQGIILLCLVKDLYPLQYNPHRFVRKFGRDQGFPKEIQVPKRPQSTGLLVSHWYQFAKNRLRSRFYILPYDRKGHPLYTYAYHLSTKLHTMLKLIHVSFIENDPSTKKPQDNAPLEKGTSPQMKKRDNHGKQT